MSNAEVPQSIAPREIIIPVSTIPSVSQIGMLVVSGAKLLFATDEAGSYETVTSS